MAKPSPLFWAAAGFGFYLLLRGGISGITSRLSFGMPRIRMGALTFTGLDAELFLPITNGLPTSIPIEGFNGQLMYGNYSLAHVLLPQALVIEANDTTALNSRVQIRYEGLTQNVIGLIQSGQLLQSLRIEGTLRAGGVNWPVNKTIRVL